MITQIDQRVKQVRMCPKMLSAMILVNGNYTFVSQLPPEAKLELAGFEPASFMFFYVFSHPSFDLVLAGDAIPIVPIDQFYIQRRIPDAELATTIK